MKDMQFYKELLIDKQQSLEEQLKRTDEAGKPVSLDESIGRLTRMDAMQRQHQALYASQRNQDSLRAVRDALARIEAGNYGLCSRCKGEIDEERLEFLPETTLCGTCMRALRG